MPTFTFTAPDGKTYDVQGPDGSTPEQAFGILQQQIGAPKAEVKGTGNRAINGVIRGLRDLPDAGAQLLTRGLEAVAPAGSGFEAWARKEREKVEAINKTAEDDYQQNWRGGATGFDVGRLGGNVLATAPLAGVGVARGATGAAKAIQTGLNAAGVTAASQPVYNPEEGFWGEKGKQAAIGAVVPTALSAAGGVVRGVTRPEVKTLIREGVTPSPGQILGGAFNSAEQKAMSLPVVGDVIASGRRAALKDFDRAAINRALEPIGQKATNIGREGVDDATRALSSAYDKVKGQIVVARDAPFDQAVGRVQQMLRSVKGAGSQADELDLILDDVTNRFTQAGRMGGEVAKETQSDLGKALRMATKRANADSGTAFDRKFADAIKEVKAQFDELILRNNPQAAQELKNVNRGYANLARVQDAAGGAGAREGIFTPAQLASSVRRMDGSVRHNAYARGNAFMQDLTDAGRSVLDQTVPDSGTTGRAALAYLLGGGGATAVGGAPALAGATAAAIPYLPGGRQAVAALLARRPQMAEPLADYISGAGPYLAPALASLLVGQNGAR